MNAHIPCTAQVVTRNSAAGIRACLDSLSMFDEVIVQDGYSTDGTRAIAAGYPNVRVMDQNRKYLDAEGRITDFAAMRNESIRAARYDWIFVVDGDEYVDPALVTEIGDIVSADRPGVYEAFRRFYIDGEAIIFCSGYPALQIRLFHRSLTDGYVKPVHERLRLHPGTERILLKTELPVPLPPVSKLQAKYDRYLAMEVKRAGVMPWGEWMRWILLRNLRSAIGLTLRIFLLRVIPARGKRMPLSHEFAYVRHSLRTIARTFPPQARKELTASATADR